ncbi:MAG: hypothetical protein OXK80_05825 [Bdellovibrionales bacterium]|nr:hypothetical protein [Bdellovibrionales bacterium]
MTFFKIKTYLHLYFKLLLSLSIILSSSYAYSHEEDSPQNTNSNLRGLISFFKSDSSEERENFLESLSVTERKSLSDVYSVFKELTSAVDRGEAEEYLRGHSDVVSELDYHQLLNQKAVITDSNRVIDFNEVNTYTHPISIVDVEMKFNRFNQMTFEGLLVKGDEDKGTMRKVGMTYVFEEVLKKDVISWDRDRDFLVLLHRERGLVVYDMRLVVTRLGEMPIPSVVLDGEILHDERLKKLETVEVEVQFVPPYKNYNERIEVSPEVDSVSINKDGEFIFVSGDLIVTIDGVVQKNYSRVDVKERLSNMYDKIVTRVILRELLVKNEDLDLKDMSIVDLSDVILRMVIPTASVSYFKPFLNEFLYISQLPVENNDHDMFQVEDISASSKKKGGEKETVWKKIRKFVKSYGPDMGVVLLSFALILSYFNGEGGVGLSYGAMAFDHGLILGIGLMLAGYVGIKISIPIFRIFAYLNNHFVIEINLKHLISTLKQRVENESLNLQARESLNEYIYKLEIFYEEQHNNQYTHEQELSAVLKQLRGFLKSNGHREPGSIGTLLLSNKTEIVLHQIIEKWGDKSVSEKATGAGFLVYSKLLIPFYKRVAQMFGYSNFFRALGKGINPLTRISPESEIGRQLDLSESISVQGGVFQYLTPTGRRRHNQQVQAINILHLKKKEIESLSRMISIRALINKPLTSQSDFRIPEGELLDELKDENFQLRFSWVSHQLIKHIEETGGSVSWTSATMQSYYAKALELSQQSLSLESSVLADIKERMLQKMRSLWDNVLHWNEEESAILRHSVPTEDVVKTFVVHLLMDHFTITTIPFVYGATPRGDLSIASIQTMGVVPGGFEQLLFGFSSDAHFLEVFMNVIAHTVISGRSQLLNIHALLERYPPIHSRNNPNPYISAPDVLNEQSFVNYIRQMIQFVFASGGETRPDIPDSSLRGDETRIDFGYQFYNFMMKYYQFIQVPLMIMIASRYLITDDGIVGSISGSMFFLFGGVLVFALPQLIQMLYNNQYLGRKLVANRNDLLLITQDIANLNRGVFASETVELNKLSGVVTKIVEVYFRNRNIIDLLEYLKDVDNDSLKKIFLMEIRAQRDLSANSFNGRASRIFDSIEDSFGGSSLISTSDYQVLLSQLRSGVLEQNLLHNPRIPTDRNNTGDILAALAALGIFSNVAFVYLSSDSYSYNTMENILAFLGVTLGLMFTGNTVYKHGLKKWKEKFKNISLREKMLLLVAFAGVASPFYAPYDITDLDLLDSMILSYALWISKEATDKIRHIVSIKNPNVERESMSDRSQRMIQRVKNKCSSLFKKSKE